METTIKGSVNLTTNNDGLIEVNYKRSSLILGILAIISCAIVIPLCFILIGIILLPIPLVLVIAFYLVQVKEKLLVQPGDGLILKKHNIAFKDISNIQIDVNCGVGAILATVKGKDVVLANLLRESVAKELYSIILSSSK
ncbi:hypothetical protein [Rivihabitans pingtungensis]|uniref:hypothetical protein n=1 Tax=Rivihabitans pingtungensis TaxID=1054498 RepID=UPI0011B48A5F|nr:hypothetical protein [Rivihabitans pingtungensis]